METTQVMETEHLPKSPGRPRAFDTDQALEAAMRLFWQKGYEGTSLSDLTAAMGINRPSLYAAFGDKEALFRKALERYALGPASYVQAALDAPTARETVERLLGGAIELMTAPRNPSGCLMVRGALACGEAAEPIRRELTARRQVGEALLRARIERAMSEGELTPDTDYGDLVRYFATVIWGLSVSAAGGATAEELRGVAELALNIWPTK